MKLVYGVGVNDKKGFWNTKEYRLWTSMLKRCYCNNYHDQNPAYIGCKVSDNFKSFSYFYDWCQTQIGVNADKWHLDKDVLLKGNREYHEDRCVFLPLSINGVFEKAKRSRGDHPIGVYFNKKRGCFVAYARLYGKFTYLGGFDCEIEAFGEYKKRKESYIKHLAEEWKFNLDNRAYDALMSYVVEIGD